MNNSKLRPVAPRGPPKAPLISGLRKIGPTGPIRPTGRNPMNNIKKFNRSKLRPVAPQQFKPPTRSTTELERAMAGRRRGQGVGKAMGRRGGSQAFRRAGKGAIMAQRMRR